MTFAVGSLVRARGREWVVLPESDGELLMVRPLGGTEEEVTGIFVPLEPVQPAQFDLPDPSQVGDHRSCRLLRDAVRLGIRSSAGPFRSLGRIAVEPRPYQLVPLLMALKLDPVRILIADDVGIGKTIEACVIARELLDRGEVQRLAVLCPPHLAEQWHLELLNKFHIEAELVLPSTAGRLERPCRVGQSLFELYPHVIVSMDYIKSDRRRDEFVRTCPELVIVDEIHTCAFGYEGRGGRHQRHQLVRQLAADPSRHLVLVTATPHSGKEEAFRSILEFLNAEFVNLPEDITGRENEPHRRRVAAHFIQRRRADIEHYLKAETPFPKRDDAKTEESYKLSPEYRRLFDRVLQYARETVADPRGGQHRQRVRWWSALALLRALASSPEAAAATLRSRAKAADTESAQEADEVGRRSVLDIDPDEAVEGIDVIPGADAEEDIGEDVPGRRRLLEMAREADRLKGEKDAKLLKAVDIVKEFLRDGYRPILFCRFIHTAEYLAGELRNRLPASIEVDAVTGLLPPSDREERVRKLGESPQHVLVCTDCLSEGINLQEHFDAVIHYDLSWNPTRHEQREGRVDRYGQPSKKVRVLTYYGVDNQIDGIVLDVLIRKHKKIRSSLGISVPVPIDTNTVIEAIFEGLLLREKAGTAETYLPGFEEFFRPKKEHFHLDWDKAAERDKRSRTMYAQESIKVDEVARELEEARAAIGVEEDVTTFTVEALRAHKAVVTTKGDRYQFDVREVPRVLRDSLGERDSFEARFKLPVGDGVLYLGRTHPMVEGIAAHVTQSALDPIVEGVARRAGVIRTAAVDRRTTLLLVRFRYDIRTRRAAGEHNQLAEECRLVAFAGSPTSPQWLDGDVGEALLQAQPHANIPPELARTHVSRVIEEFEALRPFLGEEASRRANTLVESHKRVRTAAQIRGVSYRVEPLLPPDILGIYVYLPTVEK